MLLLLQGSTVTYQWSTVSRCYYCYKLVRLLTSGQPSHAVNYYCYKLVPLLTSGQPSHVVTVATAESKTPSTSITTSCSCHQGASRRDGNQLNVCPAVAKPARVTGHNELKIHKTDRGFGSIPPKGKSYPLLLLFWVEFADGFPDDDFTTKPGQSGHSRTRAQPMSDTNQCCNSTLKATLSII
ncbi:hypothetical protein ElyMa_001762500 [Elysia marginata]|uniref:Uncharacterized protein n=1 Tax=Elysia marginata TaxID=1093978 RepID=A0AAV4EB56_9GAST|nr:hypothetical protein ElyMa_001762500 [Elysia marginata]